MPDPQTSFGAQPVSQALSDISQEDMEKAVLNAIHDVARKQLERRLMANTFEEKQEAGLRAALHRLRQTADLEVQS